MKIKSTKIEVRRATLVWKCTGKKCKRNHSLSIQITENGTLHRHDGAIVEEGLKITCTCGMQWIVIDFPQIDITSPYLIKEIKRDKKRS